MQSPSKRRGEEKVDHLPLEELSPEFMAGAVSNVNSPRPSHGATRSTAGHLTGRELALGSNPALSRSPSNLMDVSASALTSATVDLQRSLIQQQLQQAQRELKKVKEDLADSSEKVSDLTSQLNEQRMEQSSLTHRYGTVVEKLTGAESDVKRLEDQLVQERSRHKTTREEKENLKVDLRDLGWECERLQKTVEELEASRGLDQREVQRLLEDRNQYLPTAEVRRLQGEMQSSQESLVARMTSALDALKAAAEEGETSYFVARSAVLTAATDLEARVLRAEAALASAHEELDTFRSGVDAETADFLTALMSENKGMWQHLTKLQNEYDLLASEVELKRQRGEVVSLQQHQFTQRQLETATERLTKAQQVIETQTALAREHERELQSLMDQNDTLLEQLEALKQRHQTEKTASESKSVALEEAEAALKDAAQQIETLQDTISNERQKTEKTLKEVNSTNDAIQQEYEQRVRKLQSELNAALEKASRTELELEETLRQTEQVRRELGEQAEYYEAYKQKVEETLSQQERNQSDEIGAVRAILEEEIAALRSQLENSHEEYRGAVRAKEAALTKAQTLEGKLRGTEADLAHQLQENTQQRQHNADLVEQLRKVSSELEELKATRGEGGTISTELQKQLDRMTRERDELFHKVAEVTQQEQHRYEQLHKDWRSSEEARATLQEEIKLLRQRSSAAEAERQAQERQEQDRAQLMKANLKLHEQYQALQEENRSLLDQLKTLRQRSGASEQLQQQLEEFQARLRELPLLRKTADDARRDMLLAREETELLRKERDEMARRLDEFLEESKSIAAKGDDFDRIFRDASEAVKRLSGQVTTAKGRGSYASAHSSSVQGAGGDYHVFSNTKPVGRIPASAAATPKGARSASQHNSASRGRHDTSAGFVESPGKSPQRPWKS